MLDNKNVDAKAKVRTNTFTGHDADKEANLADVVGAGDDMLRPMWMRPK